MEQIRSILVVSRMTRETRKVIHYGIELARITGAQLNVVHIMYDPFLHGWNLPMISTGEEFKRDMQRTKRELDQLIAAERENGVVVDDSVAEGRPAEEIARTVREKAIDLTLLNAHGNSRLDRITSGFSLEEIMEKVPSSVLFIK